MLPRYVAIRAAGDLQVNQHVRIVQDAGPLMTLDGHAGYGQVIGTEAMALGIERAKSHGIAVVGLANSHHLGRIGHWAEQCVAAGLVSVHFVNVISEPVVAPFGGSDARFVTNPFCVGVPMPDGEPMVLDFATSRIAMGKVRVAYNKGERVGPDTLLDARGRPTTDPAVMFDDPHGALMTFGEHKGFGLAVVCEILGGALAGGLTLKGRPPNSAIINNMLSFLVDPQRLGTAQRLAAEATAFARWVMASPARQGIDRVRMPGEPEREHRRRRSAEGIPIDATTWGQIVDAAAKVGIERAEVERLAGLTRGEGGPSAADGA
jgi:uncharacterized oxidoreductase